MGISRGIDLDNYDGPVAVEVFRKLGQSYGMDFAIVGCQEGLQGQNYTQEQTVNAEAAGWAVPLHYEFLYWQPSVTEDLDRMKRAASFGRPVAIDCETTVSGWSSSQYVNRMELAKQTLQDEGLFWGWYSRKSWWNDWVGQYKGFDGDNAWSANWPFGQGKLPLVTNYPLGSEFLADRIQLPGLNNLIWQFADVCWEHSNFDMNAVETRFWETQAQQPAPLPQSKISDRNMLDVISSLDSLYMAVFQGQNPLGQKVFKLVLKPDGRDPDPPIYIAV